MKTRLLLLCCGVLLLSACATTKVVETWHDDSTHPTFNNVLVVAVNDYAPYRTLMEQEIMYHIRAAGISANAAVDVLSTTDAIDKAAAELAVKKTGADSVILVRIVGSETEEDIVPPSAYVQARYVGGWFRYYTYSVAVVPLGGYTAEYRTAKVETTVFDTATGERVWSALTKTTEIRPSDALNSYIKAMGKTLRETGLFKK
jgi:hypothetical protein